MNDFEADLKAFQRIQNITNIRGTHRALDGVQISLVDSRREVCLYDEWHRSIVWQTLR